MPDSLRPGAVLRLFLPLPLAALMACASTVDTDRTLASWAGASENELLAAWGPPTRSLEDGNRKLLIYETRRTIHVAGIPPATQNIVGGPVQLPGTPPLDVEMNCATTFTLRDAAVVSWQVAGNDCRHLQGPSHP